MKYASGPVLLLIDVQRGFQSPVWGARNNQDAEQNIGALLSCWRKCNLPVIHVQHLSLDPASPLRHGQPGVEFHSLASPAGGEIVIQKHVNSAFIGTKLDSILHQNNWQKLVVAGLTTDHCVSTTTRMASNLGFTVTVVADGTATFNRQGPRGENFPADLVHSVALASLNQEFAKIQLADSLLRLIQMPSCGLRDNIPHLGK